MHDLAVVLVSHREIAYLRACLESVFGHQGTCDMEVVLVCNGDDGSAELAEHEFPAVRVLRSENRGFAHACNTGLQTCRARFALLQNVDTEVRDGVYSELVTALDARPRVGAAGVLQVDPSGALLPTMRRFPSVARTLAEAFGSERWPVGSSSAGERILDPMPYRSEHRCDWISGSFLALRLEALDEVGMLDERFFLYAEELDLCLRLDRAGWEIRHLPVMTVLHHANRGQENPRLEAQGAYARRQFSAKHFPAPRRLAFDTALALGYAVRGVVPLGDSRSSARRRAARASLRVILGRERPPFETVQAGGSS
jgi:N-acetylglucosaminyl-diphospho-decaprenol L-rhamnosyltransferase